MGEKKQILVVEDEGIIAADVRGRLERLGYSVPAVVASGREALDLAVQRNIDLVLMDIRLNGEMDGIEAARALHLTRDVPVVYLTAYADGKTIERAKKTDPFGYLVKPIRDGSLRAAIEISLHKHGTEYRAAEVLRGCREKCQGLAGRLRKAKENECRRLARELHDDIQQRLAALALELEIHQGESGLSAQSSGLMQSASLKLRQLSRDLRRLAHHLHPRILEEQGLVPAIRRLCQGYVGQGLHVALQTKALPQVVPPDVAICLYRVAQESLQNVVRHARTDQAAVVLEGTPLGLLLRVTDGGAGFDLGVLKLGSPLGVRSMADRVEDVGGTLEVTSRPGKGTQVAVCVPLGDDIP